MARILFLTQVLPYPLDAGPKIRAYYVLRHLVSQHQVTLVSFVRPDDRPEYVNHLENICQEVHTVPMQRSPLRDARALLLAMLTNRPVIIVRDEIHEMHHLLNTLLRENHFDVVHADQTSMAQYALYTKRLNVPTFERSNVKTLLDAHNALYRIPERLAARERNPLRRLLLKREARALAHYETDLLQKFDQIVFVAEQDRQALDSSNFESRISNFPIIPICVDPTATPLIQRVPHPCNITHLGTMFWPPNVEGVLWFAREVFPRVLEQSPETRFVIVGKNPPQEILDLPLQIRNVQVTGYVPDPTPYLAETAAFLVPLHAGGGMRVKIPDAWSWGLPIVSTSIGAEGIDLQDGENILIADAADTFAQAVLRILQEPAFGETLRENGRHWVEEQYNWKHVYSKWDRIYEGLNTV